MLHGCLEVLVEICDMVPTSAQHAAILQLAHQLATDEWLIFEGGETKFDPEMRQDLFSDIRRNRLDNLLHHGQLLGRKIKLFHGLWIVSLALLYLKNDQLLFGTYLCLVLLLLDLDVLVVRVHVLTNELHQIGHQFAEIRRHLEGEFAWLQVRYRDHQHSLADTLGRVYFPQVLLKQL